MWAAWEKWRHKNEPNETIDMKNKISKMRSSWDWTNGRLYSAEDNNRNQPQWSIEQIT